MPGWVSCEVVELRQVLGQQMVPQQLPSHRHLQERLGRPFLLLQAQQ